MHGCEFVHVTLQAHFVKFVTLRIFQLTTFAKQIGAQSFGVVIWFGSAQGGAAMPTPKAQRLDPACRALLCHSRPCTRTISRSISVGASDASQTIV